MAVIAAETAKEGAIAGGRAFGRTGAYERTDGVLSFAVDPESEANGGIVDLHLAPRDADGRVTFRADFTLLAPEAPRLSQASSSQ